MPPRAFCRRYSSSSALAGWGAVSHRAVPAIASRASSARRVVGAATPTKSLSWTATTPGSSCAGPRSTDTSFAPYEGRRRTLP